MEQPMIEFRNNIEVDIEKYSNIGEENIVKLLKEYLILIDNVYEPKEQSYMVSCFMNGFKYYKSYYKENEKTTEIENKNDVIVKSKLHKLMKSVGLISQNK